MAKERQGRIREVLLRHVRNAMKESGLNWYFPHVYNKAAKADIDSNKIIFMCTKENAMPDAFKVLYPPLRDTYGFDVEYISLKQNNARFLHYFRSTARFIRKAATARCIFLEDGSDSLSCVNVRPETKVVQLWHGCGAFKKWGMSTADLLFGGSREELLKHPYYKNLSLVTVSSPEVVWAYEEAMMLEGQGIVQPTGVSRTDLLFDAGYLAQAREQFLDVVPAAEGKKVILYAPTFRGHVANAKGPEKLDIASLQVALGDEYILVIKHHPFVKKRPEIPARCTEFAFDVSHKLPMDVLLPCADICISDYSSLVFEYSLFERPMIFYAYDINRYVDWRGFYYDYNELMPGPVFDNNYEIIDYIKHIDERFDKQEVIDFKYRFMRSCDGHSTERILKIVFGDELEWRKRPNSLGEEN